MHILHLLLSNNPVPAIYGGAVQQTVQELAEACTSQGHKVTVISRAQKKQKKELSKYTDSTNVRYRYIYSDNTSRSNLLRYLGDYLKLAIENGPYDVIHTHVPYAAILFNLFKHKLGNPKIIWHIHNKGRFANLTRFFNIELVGISNSVLKEVGGDPENPKHHIIPNICRPEQFPLYTIKSKHLARKELNLPDSKIVIAFAGRISPEKGLHVLLDAIGRLHQHLQSKITLIVAGSSWFKNAEKTDYEESIMQEGKKIDVQWLGYVDNWELHKIYHACDLFVVPSIWEEPAGQVVVEAQSCGTQVIASSVGGIPEYLSPFDTSVNPNSPEDLKKAIEKSIKVGSDSMIEKKRSEWVRKRFSINQITKMWLSLYEK